MVSQLTLFEVEIWEWDREFSLWQVKICILPSWNAVKTISPCVYLPPSGPSPFLSLALLSEMETLLWKEEGGRVRAICLGMSRSLDSPHYTHWLTSTFMLGSEPRVVVFFFFFSFFFNEPGSFIQRSFWHRWGSLGSLKYSCLWCCFQNVL